MIKCKLSLSKRIYHMKIRLADYIADFLVSRGISDCFTVVGGGAMHLNDAFGHKNGLVCHYNHHEQACAIAAEAYARLDNRPALVCVTTGPAAPTRSRACSARGWIPFPCSSSADRCVTTPPPAMRSVLPTDCPCARSAIRNRYHPLGGLYV